MRPFLFVLNPAFSFLSQVSAFYQHLVPGCNDINKKSFKEDHFRTPPAARQSVLASSAKRHPSFVTLRAARPSVTDEGRGMGRVRSQGQHRGLGVGGGGSEG